MIRSIFILTLLLGTISLSAQDLYIPRDITKAFKKGTRSMDGKPGKNYWQNSAKYDITISAMPPDRNIKGEEKVTYINNSPDTLKTAIVKLFLNIHKPGAPRTGGVTADYLTSGMHVDAVTVNGTSVSWPDNANVFTSRRLTLPKPLAPHQSMTLTFTWHYEISIKSNREGMIDSTTYFLAYFYPRIAVYDDYNGWDRMNFTDSHEFYSDFNDYTVTINVPKDYVVWGTGTLQHPENLLQPEILQRFNKSLSSDETINIVTREEVAAKKITKQNATNSWQFKATNIPDMAFGLSDHYVWDGGSVVVDDVTKRRASVQAAYLPTSDDFEKMVEYGRHSLNCFSHKWPGIPYPYEKTTIFQGFAGMEYPMMANDESYDNPDFSRFVAEHEIVHTYMPFYMGINETRYGFMDEGWATTFEILIGREDMGTEKAEEFYNRFRVIPWISDPSSLEDIAIITPGDALTGPGFGNNEYGKASLGYLAMKDFLGDDMFKKCLHAYMDRWNGKHPIPWDFFNTFNNVSGKNLNWFWHNWFFTTNYIDLAIDNVKSSGASTAVVVSNIGGMVAPFDLAVSYDDGTAENFHQSPAVWQSNQHQVQIAITPKKKIKSIKLKGGIFMDADESNNEWKK